MPYVWSASKLVTLVSKALFENMSQRFWLYLNPTKAREGLACALRSILDKSWDDKEVAGAWALVLGSELSESASVPVAGGGG